MAKQVAVPASRPIGGDAASWLICAYILLIVGGFILLGSPNVMPEGNSLSRDRSFFIAVNSATLTGFQLDLQPFNDQSATGPATVFGLTFVGALLSLIIGGLAVVRILRLPYSDGKVIGAAFVWCVIAVAIGAIFIPSRPDGVAKDQHVLNSLQLSLAAFANSGAVLGRLPEMSAWQSQLVLLPLSVLGGLGLPVLLELWDLVRGRRKLSTHSNIVLGMTAGLYLAAVLYFFLMRVPTDRSQWIPVAASSSTAAINARTAGFAFENAIDWSRLMQWLVMVLMIIGAASGGTGGGLKTTTVAELFRGTRRLLKGEGRGRSLGVALVWTGIYLAAMAGVFLSLLWSTGRGGSAAVRSDQALFESISALSNVGLSYSRLTYTGADLFILSAGMLIGRIAPLVILWWMAETTDDADVAVG